MAKAKAISMAKSVEETKKVIDAEIAEFNSLTAQAKDVKAKLETVKKRLEARFVQTDLSKEDRIDGVENYAIRYPVEYVNYDAEKVQGVLPEATELTVKKAVIAQALKDKKVTEAQITECREESEWSAKMKVYLKNSPALKIV